MMARLDHFHDGKDCLLSTGRFNHVGVLINYSVINL